MALARDGEDDKYSGERCRVALLRGTAPIRERVTGLRRRLRRKKEREGRIQARFSGEIRRGDIDRHEVVGRAYMHLRARAREYELSGVVQAAVRG